MNEAKSDVCGNCRGHGADPLSDNVNSLPCRACGGSGTVARREPFPYTYDYPDRTLSGKDLRDAIAHAYADGYSHGRADAETEADS